MNIIEKRIDDLIMYENNPKIHTDEQIDKIAKSIELTKGLRQPIVIDKNNVIVVGHGRVQAAMQLGLETVPCELADDLTDEEIRAYRLIDNELAKGESDLDLLEQELASFNDIDMSDFGFDINMDDEVSKETVEDDYDEELPAEPKTKLGDLYQLGKHRLICGDSTDPAVIDRLMDGVKADMVFTDPPYNMSDHLTGFANEKTKRALSTIVDFDPNTVTDTLFAIKTNNYFIFTSKELIPKYFKIFEEWGFNILVWCKDNPTPMTNNTFLPDVEYLLYFYKNGRVWNNGLDVSVYKKYYNSNKMEGRKEAGNVHPTIKPIKIIADKIQICSNKNGIVVDLFGGSGSTLIACEQLNRKCYMCELDPHYVDVIISRWEQYTGKKAMKIND
jgi:site-specific DNA-methyltransferase (adenine-specific)